MITSKIEPLNRDIALILRDDLSPAAQSKALADLARESLAEGEEINAAAFGQKPAHETFVDGARGGDVDKVRPDGVIVFEFDIVRELLEWIDEQLREISPVKTGRYKRSHRVFIDGVETPIADVPANAQEIVFLSTVPYARMMEPHGGRPGQSKQAPDGVYQVVAEIARKRRGNVAKIEFTYRALAGVEESQRERSARPNRVTDLRQPAIVVRLG